MTAISSIDLGDLDASSFGEFLYSQQESKHLSLDFTVWILLRDMEVFTSFGTTVVCQQAAWVL
jgi:hypothetical protein